jgi:hypothetical protein
MAIMNASVTLAEANQANLSNTTKAMINVMNAWDISAENARHAAGLVPDPSV